jgi:hypothetical protein
MVLSPNQLVVHCLLERKGDQWQAFTIEFGLAAQGDSAAEVKRKLEQQVSAYLFDALVGEDQEHAEALLRRKATLSVRAKYRLASLRARIGRDNSAYSRPVPLTPAACPVG